MRGANHREIKIPQCHQGGFAPIGEILAREGEFLHPMIELIEKSRIA